MVKQWTVAGQKTACYLEGLGMPILRLLCLYSLIKASWTLVYFILQLYDESYFGRYAKISHNVKADSFQECITRHLLFISSMHCEIISLNGRDLHYVSNVKGIDPLRLIQKTKDVPHIKKL